MNPLRLHARNYRCFKRLDLDFPDGCVAILGDNGAGKSSIVNAIDISIFGARSLADVVSDNADDDLVLELEFEHDGRLYRIRRTYNPRGRGKTTLDFEQKGGFGQTNGVVEFDHIWGPLTRSSAKETQELIEETIGLSRDTFRASAFLAQGDGAAFTDAQPRDRKRILAQVLGLNRYDRLQEQARRERASIQARRQELAGRLGFAEQTVTDKDVVVAEHDRLTRQEVDLVDELADLHRTHEGRAEQYRQAAELKARAGQAQAELREAQAAYQTIAEKAATAERAANVIAAVRLELGDLHMINPTTIQAELDRLIQAELAYQENERRRTERGRLNAEAAAMLEKAATLKEQANDVLRHFDSTECDRCGHLLGLDGARRAADSYRVEACQLENEASIRSGDASLIPVADLPAVEHDQIASQRRLLDDANAVQARRALLAERINQMTPIAQSAPNPEDVEAAREHMQGKAFVAAQFDPVDADAIAADGRLIREEIGASERTLQMVREAKARHDERLAQIAEAEAVLAAGKHEADTLTAQLIVVEHLERAYGRDGIPALIIENAAIPYLETEADRILSDLGTNYRVELRTQAELKSSDGLRDTLDVIVQTDRGIRTYETFSGGERTRINLALRIALARLLAHRRGAESRLLTIDEPEFLDDAGTTALVQVLGGLRGDFDKLYIVSHIPALRDSFDTTLTVVRDGDWSRIDAGLTEAVTA